MIWRRNISFRSTGGFHIQIVLMHKSQPIQVDDDDDGHSIANPWFQYFIRNQRNNIHTQTQPIQVEHLRDQRPTWHITAKDPPGEFATNVCHPWCVLHSLAQARLRITDRRILGADATSPASMGNGRECVGHDSVSLTKHFACSARVCPNRIFLPILLTSIHRSSHRRLAQ